MARLENPVIRMKRLVAVMSMTAVISFAMWSQKPQTGFSDLKHRRATSPRSQMMVPPVKDERPVLTEGIERGGRVKYGYDDENAWTCTSFINLGYVMDQTLKFSGTAYGYNAKWGAAFQVGNSYLLPKEALFGIAKIGIDATWFDLSGVQYDDNQYNRYQIAAGMGIGASLHIAPLANLGGVLGPLRIEAYCRFVPSYSVILRQSKDKFEDENGELKSGEMKAYGAFLPVVSSGVALDYRAFGIGYEYRFGNGDYKDLVDDRGKTKYDMTSSRVYISLRM